MSIPQHIGPIDVVALIPYVSILCIIGFILAIVPGLIWIERVVIALMQDRLGPNRVGPRGLLQTIADGIKLFFKEDVEPAAVDKPLYYLAPVMTMIPALAAGATLPFGSITVTMDRYRHVLEATTTRPGLVLQAYLDAETVKGDA